jgi:8-oxo-dGTP pyrophosphatase MutT (NUDIX family)
VWGSGSGDWYLYTASVLPTVEDCTAAFCVAITHDQKVVLEREERGWGMIGGHIELDENVERALARECLEEGGFTPDNPKLYAYRKIIASVPVSHADPTRSYPFPISYIAYYWATSNTPIVAPTEPEVIESKAFGLEDLKKIGTPDLSVIMLGWNAYKSHLD